MSLKIVKIHNHGDANEEFIVLKADADINIHQYMVADRTFKAKGDLSNVHRHTFRFPEVAVKKGEYVVLFTRTGTNGPGKMKDDSAAYFFYWESKAAIWNDNEVEQAELLEVKTVDKEQVGKPKLLPRKLKTN